MLDTQQRTGVAGVDHCSEDATGWQGFDEIFIQNLSKEVYY